MNITIQCGKDGCEGYVEIENLAAPGFGHTEDAAREQWTQVIPIVNAFFSEHQHDGKEVISDVTTSPPATVQ